MIQRPKFKDKYVVKRIPGDGTFLLSEAGNYIIDGADIDAVSPFLTGHHTREQIVGNLAHTLSPAHVQNALGMLEQQGHLQDQPQYYLPPEFSAFWSELNVDLPNLPHLIANVRLSVLGLSGANTTGLVRQLQAFGFGFSEQPNFVFAVCDDYEDPALAEINKYCLERKIPWMLLKPGGVNTWVGPIFVADRTACWSCLQSRLLRNREVEGYVRRRTGHQQPFPTSRARLELIQQQAFSTAILQFLRWLAVGTNPALESRIFISETLWMNFSFHTVIKRPQCPSCGNPAHFKIGGTEFALTERTANANTDGGVRGASPEQTFATYAHHVSPITGVVSNVSSWYDNGPVKVFTAGHNFALKNDSLYFLRDGLRTNSSGKGKTEAQARTSALCEALERFCGVHSGEETRIEASLEELGDKGIDPRQCMLYSERQYVERDAWLARNSRFQVVPRPFDPTARLDWSPIRSLHNGIKYLPTAYLYYGYPLPEEKFYCWADSNGNAAGATIEDALLQATLEIVERDAVAVWWYNRIARPAVNLDSLEDPFIEELRKFYRSHNREFWVLDLTHDLGIPVFAGVTRRLSGPTEDIVVGFGAHVDRSLAVSRALAEMNQFLPAVLNVGADGVTQYGYGDPDTVRWWREARVETQSYVLPAGEVTVERRSPADQPGPLHLLNHCFEAIQKAGHEIHLLDQSRPDVGLPVVKVIAPGIRHFWARYAPGRLYDVPVKMGWLERKLTEEELNPIAMFV